MEGEQGQTEVQQEQMQIFLRTIKTVPLKVNFSDTIEHIKAKFSEQEGIAVNQQELFFSDKHLKDTRTLADYNVPNNSTINLYVGDGMELSIRIPAMGKTIRLDVKKWDPISAVKDKIQIKEGIPPKKQILIYLGRTLHDNVTISTCDIKDGAKLIMMLRPVDEMQISVAMICGRTITLEVSNWYIIADIKLMIENLEGIPSHKQMLIHDGKQLEDHLTLLDNKISNDSILHLELGVQLFVKSWFGKTVTIMVSSTDTIANVLLKAKNKMVGFNMKNHMLLYNGRILREGKALADYCINHGSTIHLRALASYEVKYQIFVEIEDKETLSLNVQFINTIKDVKFMISGKTNISFSQQELYFHGKCLPDERNLKYIGVQRGSTLTLRRKV